MDIQPIYCAEQIQVPQDLAEVLKVFTKEVIRRQPANLLEFSSRYFADQAAQHRAQHAVAPPSRQQLRQAWLQLRETPRVPLADLTIACGAAGIPAATVASIVTAGRLDSAAAPVSVLEVLLLLLSMGCDSFAATVRGMFEVFGSSSSSNVGGAGSQQLAVADLLALLGFLVGRDAEVSSAVLEEVAGALDGQAATDFAGLRAIPALANRLMLKQ